MGWKEKKVVHEWGVRSALAPQWPPWGCLPAPWSPRIPHLRPGSWCLWGSGRWLWLLELGGLGDKELRRKRLQLEVVQERGVLGWSLLVPELLPSENIAISRVGKMEESRDLPSFISSSLPHFLLSSSYKYYAGPLRGYTSAQGSSVPALWEPVRSCM